MSTHAIFSLSNTPKPPRRVLRSVAAFFAGLLAVFLAGCDSGTLHVVVADFMLYDTAAVARMKEQAKQGDVEAQFHCVLATVGEPHFDTRIKDKAALTKALRDAGLTVEKLSKKDDAKSQYVLGFFHYWGLDGLPDDKTGERKAVELFLLAAKQGHAGAQLLFHDASKGDKETKKYWLAESAKQGDIHALFTSYVIFRKDDAAKAKEYWNKFISATKDRPRARIFPAMESLFANGNDEKKLFKKAAREYLSVGDAVKFLQEVAKTEKTTNLYLGVLYYHGSSEENADVVKPDKAKAVKYFEEAAAAGEVFGVSAAHEKAVAEFYLGFMYYNGEGGLPKDKNEASKHFLRSLQKGTPILWWGTERDKSILAEMFYASGYMYYSGEGVIKVNKEKGFELLKVAAGLGHDGAKAIPTPIRIADLGVEMLPIPTGSFQMGSQWGSTGIFLDEPKHNVTLTKSFWLGKYPVTQEQYEKLMGANPSFFRGAKRPVEQVSWTDAMAFCKKLNERERAAGRLPNGYEYTLPTEAQWEWACRARTMTATYNKKEEFKIFEENNAPALNAIAWYAGNCGVNFDASGGSVDTSKQFGMQFPSKKGGTHDVGEKEPNDFGLYDMIGNVAEWCSDWHDENYYKNSPPNDPTGPASGENRIVRGGSWNDSARLCRSAARDREMPDTRRNHIGFRLALVPIR